MKTSTHPVCKIIFWILVLTTPATLVEGKKEMNLTTSKVYATKATASYHAADVIKKYINYTVSASLISANSKAIANEKAIINRKAIANMAIANAIRVAAAGFELKMVIKKAVSIYEEMNLQDSGLSEKAFEYAWRGYIGLQKRGLLNKTDVLSICDFSQSSSLKRMYVIDVRNKKLLFRTYVAHGVNSGEEYANDFSNKDESLKSSLGFYVTRKTYVGRNGLSLRIDGLDKGFNDHAYNRNIVIHGASYVSQRILNKYGVMGTTFGCPAIPTEMSDSIIPVVKNGSCFFIYYPSKKYLAGSPVLNGGI